MHKIQWISLCVKNHNNAYYRTVSFFSFKYIDYFFDSYKWTEEMLFQTDTLLSVLNL